MNQKVVMVTGGSKRIGATIVRACHRAEMNVIIHYHQSKSEAEALASELNTIRPNSAHTLCADLRDIEKLPMLMTQITTHKSDNGSAWGRLDALINNASAFYSTSFTTMTIEQWHDLLTINAQAPLFLAKAVYPLLQQHNGTIVNILDIHIERPLSNYPIYSFSKSLLSSLTTTLANECAPQVRVNAVAPGVILWPEGEGSIRETVKANLIDRTLLKRPGKAEDIAEAVLYFLQANYVTGQLLAVDGGRMIND